MSLRSNRIGRVLLLLVTLGMLVGATVGPAAAKPRTVLIAGDIARGTPDSGETLTAGLIDRRGGRVLTAGDNAYETGTLAQFKAHYEPTWGRFLGRTRPTPGNHDYYTPNAAGYFDYFGWRAGPDRRGYYALKVGSWHIYMLDSELCKLAVGCGPGSPEFTWLKRTLARQRAVCSMAVFHTPLYSSGIHGNDPRVRPLVRLLYKFGAELIVNGHEHDYERMAPALPSGKVDRRKGVQQIIAGTGGAPLRRKGTHGVAQSRAFSSDAWGVLKLRLYRRSYTWRFVPVEGASFSDQGKRSCHGRP